MMNNAVTLIRELLAGKDGARDRAERFVRTVTPRWDADLECLVATHPTDGQEYMVKLEDVNGSIRIHADLGDESQLTLEIDDGGGDWSDTVLMAIFDDDRVAFSDLCFFVSDDFKHDWAT